MFMFIRLLRAFAYLLGVAGALIVLNIRDPFWHKVGWVLIFVMVPVFVTVQVLTVVQSSKAKHSRRRR